MKGNWINILAGILIVAGIFLLVRRSQAPTAKPGATTERVTEDKAKALAQANVEATLGRPLNDIEKQMMEATKVGNGYEVKLLEPLKSRYDAAKRMRAATQVSTTQLTPAPQGGGNTPMTPMPATMP
ncbi:MAG: hypothetical protein JO353_12245 [Phycisphaerae bacterium]|nr:hypothetical protein [Phycisphaerae bacterium]